MKVIFKINIFSRFNWKLFRGSLQIINSSIDVVANWKMYAEMYQVDEKKTHAIDRLLLKELK
ncbi:hypothetical protein HX095_11605 [Empedobacter falsenii]|uniref:Uncharacterized protein n=1 Tax=Empedobacter falsenii TaxID=343874 RepID=A0AAW7DIP2_9FLAO|nr:hypothetical protein [Empedobacter falsenii]